MQVYSCDLDCRSAHIKISDKQWLICIHFIWDQKHVYLFVLDLTLMYIVASFWLDR